ncbi:hypothetical protein NKI38_02460 [Mesorhizobium sp. M0621]|uniref:hypothetical protein n=1 Tax=Mesorhizobium sp. M0621 TaxID=2956974 RepID=UPI0033378DB6
MSLLKVRTTIVTIIKSAAKGGDISTKTLIEALRKDYAAIISTAQSELETIALTKIVNEVARRRVREVPGQSELFGGYSGIWQTIVVKSRGPDGKLRYEPKAINVASPEEVEAWLQEHTQPSGSTWDWASGIPCSLSPQSAREIFWYAPYARGCKEGWWGQGRHYRQPPG